MANKHRNIDQGRLQELADEYCDECINNKKILLTRSGKKVEIEDRLIPTVDYFLSYWLRKQDPEFQKEMIGSRQFYRVIKDKSHPLCQTIKNIRADFDALAVDIVANEGKGIFYAKNRLGMTDRIKKETDQNY